MNKKIECWLCLLILLIGVGIAGSMAYTNNTMGEDNLRKDLIYYNGGEGYIADECSIWYDNGTMEEINCDVKGRQHE